MAATLVAKETVIQRLKEVFSITPAVVARAPGRVEVLGNHTDYNDGVVLSAAIDREVWIAIAKSPTRECKLTSTHFSDPAIVNEIVPQKGAGAWVNYPLGVYSVLKEQGYPVSPFIINHAINYSV